MRAMRPCLGYDFPVRSHNMKNTLLIGLTSRRTEVYHSDASYFINDYAEYLKAAGIPVLPVLLPLCDASAASEAAARCDGLLITGGEDVNPYVYGRTDEGKCSCEPKVYDETDILLYTSFRDAAKPVFGICRGIQLINAAEGGTLIQDIPSLTGTEHNQRNADEAVTADGTFHPIRCLEGSRMYDTFGKTVRVNSFHHQAVGEPAPGFTVSAYAPDGIIEAIEKDRVFAVQWHPERMRNDEQEISLAAQFLKLCAGLR